MRSRCHRRLLSTSDAVHHHNFRFWRSLISVSIPHSLQFGLSTSVSVLHSFLHSLYGMSISVSVLDIFWILDPEKNWQPDIKKSFFLMKSEFSVKTECDLYDVNTYNYINWCKDILPNNDSGLSWQINIRKVWLLICCSRKRISRRFCNKKKIRVFLWKQSATCTLPDDTDIRFATTSISVSVLHPVWILEPDSPIDAHRSNVCRKSRDKTIDLKFSSQFQNLK